MVWVLFVVWRQSGGSVRTIVPEPLANRGENLNPPISKGPSFTALIENQYDEVGSFTVTQ